MRIRTVTRRVGLGVAALLGANLILAGAAATRVGPAAVPLCGRPFGRGEWGTDVLVEVSLSRPPAAGQVATLVVDVCAKRFGRLHLDIALPAGFAWVVLPPGFTPQDRISRRPENFGCLHAAHAAEVLPSFEPLRLTATVRAGKPGPATVTVSAEPESGPGDTSYAYLTVGRTSRSSHFGFGHESSSDSAATTATPPPTPFC